MDFKPYLQEIKLRASASNMEGYPFNIPAIQHMLVMKFHRDVTFIVGENGSGKSTFIEALAQFLGMSKEGGSRHNNTLTSRDDSALAHHFDSVMSYRRPGDTFFLRAESLYNVATYLDEAHADSEEEKDKFRKLYGVESLHECSHGESFLAILANRLGSNGLYIFDEPEAALSPSRQLTALTLIHQLVEQNCQLIIATHSPILLAYPNATIYQFDDTGVKEVLYEECEQYTVTKSFLNNHQYMTSRLLDSGSA